MPDVARTIPAASAPPTGEDRRSSPTEPPSPGAPIALPCRSAAAIDVAPAPGAELVPRSAIAAQRHPARVYLAGLPSPSSRRVMRLALQVIAELLTDGRCDVDSLPWESLRYQHTAAIRSRLAAGVAPSTGDPYAPATANRMLAALRGCLKEAWRLGLLSAEDLARAVDLAPIKGSRLPRGRALPPAELGALIAECAADPTPWGARDLAMLGLLYGAGLRRAELVALDLADVDRADSALVVRGKGNRERRSFVDAGVLAALGDWLARRGEMPGPLFCRIQYPNGRVFRAARLTPEAVARVLAKRAGQAEVPRFSPHDLRRSFISDLLEAGADLSTIKDLAGHASITTTVRYDRRGEAAQRKARGLIRFPYRSRR